MGLVPPLPPNWRNDPGLTQSSLYKKKFAILPKVTPDGSVIWMKRYYKRYVVWSHNYDTESYYHKEFIENVIEEDYIIWRLSGNL